MATRRASQTSLAQYARPGATSPSLNPSLDFCNSFWGVGDAGVDVLFARLRGAIRTIEEVKAFWKERCSIEEEYAKRLSKLAKQPLGRDEIGEMRASLDSIRLETDRQSGFHMNLVQTIRNDLEGPTTTFQSRLLDMKKNSQAGVEREFKAKQMQEGYVTKAREKYESDCMRINSYTAQTGLVQGRDLEKIRVKLERAEQTVSTNERDFMNFAKVYGEMAGKWENVWKDFCDRAQDMEEARLEFVKDVLWAYANAISTTCVSDDESCEIWRVGLEQMEPEREMVNFVRDYGTGNHVPDPPRFVNLSSPDAIPPSSAKPTYHEVHFTRVSRRERKGSSRATPPPPEEPFVNTAGVGAGGPKTWQPEQGAVSRQPTRASSHSHAPNTSISSINSAGGGAVNGSSVTRKNTVVSQARASQQIKPPADPLAEPSADTFIKVGGHAYKVNPDDDPQISPMRTGSSIPARSPSSAAGPGSSVDPLAQQLENLQNAAGSSSSKRITATWPTHPNGGQAGSSSRRGTLESSLNPPSGVAASPGAGRPTSPMRDYRNSAEVVVGSHPSLSRPVSPIPAGPSPAFMVPPKSVSPSNAQVVEGVISDYHQSLPGERKSLSRRGSYIAPFSEPVQGRPQSMGASLSRPPSTGHAGIGAHGGSRSNSPQPISRAPSPAPAPGQTMSPTGPVTGPSRMMSVPPPGAAGIARTPSPNSVGIALDPSGRVMHDDMAQRYLEQQQRPVSGFGQRPASAAGPHVGYNTHPQAAYNTPPQSQTISPARASYIPAVGPPPPLPHQQPPPAQPTYGMAGGAPRSPVYHQAQNSYSTPSPQPTYQAPAPPVQHSPYSSQHSQSASQGGLSGYGSGNLNGNGVQRAQSVAAGYGYGGQQQQPQPQQQHQRQSQAQQQGYYNSGYQQQQQQPSMHSQQPSYDQMRRSPSPQPPGPPTGQLTEEGVPILFYVQALYDYAATIDEEFDFQAGDIIAVTATPKDGWWSGQLLDDTRRQRGKYVFPSNFVALF